MGAGGRIVAPCADSQKLSESALIAFLCLWSAMGQGNSNPAGRFQGLGFDQAIAYTVGSVSQPAPSSSCCCTLYVDFTVFFTAVACTSLGIGSDLEHSFVFL